MGGSAASADAVDDVAICVDFGSTFTKAALVDLAEGRIVAAASHPTTIGDATSSTGTTPASPPWPSRTRGRPTPRCSPAPAPAVACGSPWSATRSW